MALEGSGLKIAVLDKEAFPRDKICGDFVAAKGIRELAEIKPEIHKRLAHFPRKVINRTTHFYVDELKPLDLNWVLESYTLKRLDFDNQLVELMLEAGKVDFYPQEALRSLQVEEAGVKLKTTGHEFKAKMVVGADGAHSRVARDLAHFKVDKNHYGGSVRAYFRGVENIEPHINEVYLHRRVIPGYFWLFPISPTKANVGLGMHSTYITKQKINLKDRFYEFIEQSALLRSKVGNAEMEGKLEGFGLPFFSKKHTIAGDRFILLGDAASMIDPTNGEGIMPAIISAKMAAKQIEKAFNTNDFSASMMEDYEKAIHQRFWSEMKLKSLVVKHFADKPHLIHLIGSAAVNLPFIKRSIQKLM